MKVDPLMKKYVAAVILLILIGVISVLAARHHIISKAKTKAIEILNVAKASEDEILFITQHVHEVFNNNRKTKNFPILFRLRPFLSNERLPGFIKLPDGVIETIYPFGWCDNAARMTQFIFAQDGVETEQWNMVTPTGAHAALQASYNGTNVFIDPFYGVLPKNKKGDYINAEQAKKEAQKGRDVFNAIADTSTKKFYTNFDRVMMAAQGNLLEIDAQLIIKGEEVVLGKVDGTSKDVHKAGVRNKISPHWTYLGHRYDRSWSRAFSVSEPSRVTFTLTKEPSKKIITSNKKPEISGKKLTWVLGEGEKLIFKDGNAGFLWGDLKSYIEVDQITVTPLGSASL